MSKYLIKILSICAFVILFPLIIVGSALCVTEAMACTLKVLSGGVEGGYGASSNVSIFINNEKQDLNEVSVKKNTEVTVTYEGVGYDFVGWYNGNYEEIDRAEDSAVSTSVSYTFFVRGNTTLTAVRDVKEYTITYAGQMDDGSDVVVEPAVQTYKYGESLKYLEPVAGATFDGWYIVNSANATAYKTAIFPVSGEYTVNPAWSDQMIITYKDRDTDTIIAQDRVSEASLRNYQLVASDDERVVNYLNENKSGYEFVSWVDVNGNDVQANNIEFLLNDEYVIYLKAQVKAYTITVQRSEIDEATADITYNVKDGFSAYDTTGRRGYNFVGLVYNDTLYTFDSENNDYLYNGISLATVIVSEDARNINVVAEWDCVYPDVALYINGVSNYSIDGLLGNYEVFGKVGSDYQMISDIQKIVMFEDKVGENYYNTSVDVIGLAFGGYEGIYRQTGFGTGVYEQVELKQPMDTVQIFVNNIDKGITLGTANGELTFNDIFSAIQDEGIDINTVTKLTLTFEFVLA